ncbi:MAG: hypothetical protein NT062_28145 [Proteobacteria bacterium]|nr:hypothetical protein [Pseudomonadota bacterium]
MFAAFALASSSVGEVGIAAADEQPHRYPGASATIAVVVRDDHGGGTDTSSAGMSAELALGGGRFQYFVEGSQSWIQTQAGGVERRGGVGIRWLARSFEAGDGAIEMHLEGVGGLTHVEHDTSSSTYPDVGFGVGWQVRMLEPRLAFRITARAMFAQTTRDVACRGTCMTASSVPGFVVLVGFGW